MFIPASSILTKVGTSRDAGPVRPVVSTNRPHLATITDCTHNGRGADESVLAVDVERRQVVENRVASWRELCVECHWGANVTHEVEFHCGHLNKVPVHLTKDCLVLFLIGANCRHANYCN